MPMKEVKQIRRRAVAALVESRRTNASATGLASGPVRMNLHEEMISKSQHKIKATKNIIPSAQARLLSPVASASGDVSHGFVCSCAVLFWENGSVLAVVHGGFCHAISL